MKKALVTGGCGFIGSNLSKELVNQGWQVDIIDDMSNGHVDLVSDLDCRFLPSAAFISVYNLQELGKNRKQKDVVVIQDDFACDFILEYITTGAYDVIFHQAAIPRVKLYSFSAHVLLVMLIELFLHLHPLFMVALMNCQQKKQQ